MGLKVSNVNKSYSNIPIIRNLSMDVQQGSIFGFLGPNGAGKTTTMRMILDITRPDNGTITWNNRSVRAVPRRCWGYLPEERGLYPKMTVEDQLLFLARMYGLPRKQIQTELDEWLERFQITSYRKKIVSTLSKGNQQKIQFIATILHNPDILIMDEPFSGLDPVNMLMLKDAFLEMHRRHKTIIFSTHQMHQVEELCENIVIMNKGQIVIQGNVKDIKRQSGRQLVRLTVADDTQTDWLDAMPGISDVHRRQDYTELRIQTHVNPDDILQAALNKGGHVTRFELVEPSLNDIFVAQVSDIAMPDTPVPVS